MMEHIKALLMEEDSNAIIQGLKTRLFLDTGGFTVRGENEYGVYTVELYDGPDEELAVQAFRRNEQ